MRIISLSFLFFLSASTISGNEELIEAAFENDLEKVKQLLNDGANVDYRKSDTGTTALMASSWEGHADVVRFLLGKDASCNLKDAEKNRALHIALFNGHLEISQMLWEKFPISNSNGGSNLHKRNLLHLCCMHPHPEYANLARKILERGRVRRKELNTIDSTGSTPLFTALKQGSPEMANLLIEAKCDVLSTGYDGRTCLHLASMRRGFTNLIDVIHDRGAHIDEEDDFYDTALHLALRHGPKETIRRLIRRGANATEIPGQMNETPLHLACMRNDLSNIIGMILRKGAEVNAKDIHGVTPLHRALKGGHRNIAWKLLKAGANLTLTDRHGNSPLTIACARDTLNEIVMLMLETGFDPNYHNGNGDSALNIAARAGQLKNVQSLVDYEADIDDIGSDDLTPLESGALSDKCDATKLARILINAVNPDERENLFWKFILRKGAMAVNLMAEYPETDYDYLLSQYLETDFVNCPEFLAFVVNNGVAISKGTEILRHFAPRLCQQIPNLLQTNRKNFAEFFSKAVELHVGTQVADTSLEFYAGREIFALYRITKKIFEESVKDVGKNDTLIKYDDKARALQQRYQDEILSILTNGTYLYELPMELISDIVENGNCAFPRELHRFSFSLSLAELTSEERIIDENGLFSKPDVIFKHFENISL